MSSRLSRALGFSMIEVLVVSAILPIVLLTIYTVYDNGLQNYARGTARADVQQNIRVALESMARELRAAGYSPSTTGCPSPPSGAITAIGTSPVSVALQADVDGNNCTDQVIYTFDPPADPSKPCDASDATTIGKITRSVQVWSNGTWSPATPVPSDVAQCVTGLTITYYNSSGTTEGNPADVRRISIAIAGAENVRGFSPRTYTLTSDVRLRNL